MSTPFILFELADTTYAVRADRVEQLEMIETVTRVPNAAPHVDGLVYVRGRAVPVVNMRRRCGLERIPYDLRARLVVVTHGPRTVALAVDSAREFVRLDADAMEPVPEASATESSFLEGLVSANGRLILVIDIPMLLDGHPPHSPPEERTPSHAS